jgi:hypothetical protein
MATTTVPGAVDCSAKLSVLGDILESVTYDLLCAHKLALETVGNMPAEGVGSGALDAAEAVQKVVENAMLKLARASEVAGRTVQFDRDRLLFGPVVAGILARPAVEASHG